MNLTKRHLNGSVSDLPASCRSEFIPAISECEHLPTLPELSIMGGGSIELKGVMIKMTERHLEFLEGILWNENSSGREIPVERNSKTEKRIRRETTREFLERVEHFSELPVRKNSSERILRTEKRIRRTFQRIFQRGRRLSKKISEKEMRKKDVPGRPRRGAGEARGNPYSPPI